MGDAIFYARWQVARALIHLGIRLAPEGSAKALLVRYLNTYGAEIMVAIVKARKDREESNG